MIPLLAGWSVEHEVGMLELVHPRGRDVAVIHYRERVRPLRKVSAIVTDYLAALPGFRVTEPYAAQPVVTREGEHAALVTLVGTHDGRPEQRDLGFVFGDDFFASIAGRTSDVAVRGELTQLVRELVERDAHMLGVRRRRFVYAAPADWEPLVDGFTTDWYPPEFPNDGVALTVQAATPRTASPVETIAAMMRSLGTAGHHVDALAEPTEVRSRSGLHGELVTLTIRPARGAAIVKRVAVLADTAYTYAVEATARSSEQLAAHAGLVERVVASIEPIPQGTATAPELHLFAHFAD